MQYLAGLLGGVAASALFWVVDKYLLALPQTYQILGAATAFLLFGLAGYLLASRNTASTEHRFDTDVASDLRGSDVEIAVDGLNATGHASVGSRARAKRGIKANIKNVTIRP